MDADEVLRMFFGERPGLEAFLVAATRDYHLAQDVLQEVAIVLVRKAGDYDPARPFGPWLRSIARKELALALRKRSGDAALLAPDTLEGLAPAFGRLLDEEDARARREALAACVESMKGDARRAIDLRYRERKDCGEIASLMGRTTQAVYAVLKRAKEALKRCVEGRLALRRTRGS